MGHAEFLSSTVVGARPPKHAEATKGSAIGKTTSADEVGKSSMAGLGFLGL